MFSYICLSLLISERGHCQSKHHRISTLCWIYNRLMATVFSKCNSESRCPKPYCEPNLTPLIRKPNLVNLFRHLSIMQQFWFMYSTVFFFVYKEQKKHPTNKQTNQSERTRFKITHCSLGSYNGYCLISNIKLFLVFS